MEETNGLLDVPTSQMGLKEPPRVAPESPEMEAMIGGAQHSMTPADGKKADPTSGTCDKCAGTGLLASSDAAGKQNACDSCGGSGKIAKTDKSEQIIHIDSSPLSPEWMTERFEITPDGFLKGRAVVTNVGVFEYRKADGSTVRELRLPEEVFHPDSLETLKCKPVTNDHPKKADGGLVTPKNAKTLQVGSTGSNPSSYDFPYGSEYAGLRGKLPQSDGYRLAIDLAITDGDTIKAVQDGKRALSCGYVCDSEPAAPGAVWMGMPYDIIQRKIRYNHVAIVASARAGDDAKIRMDEADDYPEAFIRVDNRENFITEDEMKAIKLDGVEYQAEARVIETLTQQTARADAAEAQITTLKADSAKLEADRDTQKARADKAEQDLAEAKAARLDEKAILEAVKARTSLLAAAQKAGAEVKEDSTDQEIRKAVIAKVFSATDLTTLDGKSDDYITARFDGAMDALVAQGNAAQRAVLAGNLPGSEVKADEKPADSRTARQKMIAEMQKGSRFDAADLEKNK